MKAASLRITMTAMLALAFMAASETARAQEALVVNIPFAFTVGSMALPAGEYRVERIASDSPALRIQRADKGASSIVLSFASQANATPAQSTLVFHRYNDRYFLYQVWTAGSRRGRELRKSPQEKEQALAARHEMPDLVTIVARLVVAQP